LQAAWSTYKRLDETCDGRVSASTIAELGENGLRELGFSRQKARYTRLLAENVLAKRFRIGSLRHQDDAEVRRRIVSQLGLGNWSADIYLLMALCRRDVFPLGDLAITKGISKMDDREYHGPEQILERAESWRPYRSVATRMIWQFYLNRNT
jgi:DNA-3-methyladenine glycosylase II